MENNKGYTHFIEVYKDAWGIVHTTSKNDISYLKHYLEKTKEHDCLKTVAGWMIKKKKRELPDLPF